jgi:hypothetical protein
MNNETPGDTDCEFEHPHPSHPCGKHIRPVTSNVFLADAYHLGFPVYVEGYKVPYIEVGRVIESLSNDGPDRWHFSITLDDRMGIDATDDELQKWMPFVAHAMAVAAGRTSHGANSNIRNPHGENLAGIPTPTIEGAPAVG